LVSGLAERADTAAPGWKLRPATGRVKRQVSQRQVNRPFRAEDVFALQDDLVLISSTIALESALGEAGAHDESGI